MDITIIQFGQDLARAGYTEATCSEYLKCAEALAAFLRCPMAEATREQVRQFVDALPERGLSATMERWSLCALLFVFRRTLGKPDFVSFIKLLRRYLVLHTWDKQLGFHPHVHAIVTAGGPRPDGSWASSQQQFLFPVVAMARVQRGKMRAALRSAYRDGTFEGFDDFEDPQAFDQLMRTISKKNWHIYAKRSFDQAKHVVEYLGRYTHRVALSNSRLLVVTDDRVVIRTRGDGRAAMSNVELLRRFVRHVLPKGLHKIRHFGIYAHPTCNPAISSPVAPDYAEKLLRLTGRDILRCPRCASPLVPRPLAIARSPPMQAA